MTLSPQCTFVVNLQVHVQIGSICIKKIIKAVTVNSERGLQELTISLMLLQKNESQCKENKDHV